VSPEPWDSLNVGATVGDALERVIENRTRSFNGLDRDYKSNYDVWQVHGSEVICTDAPRQSGTPIRKADAILTDQPHVTLFMRFADCVPVFLYDPVQAVVGIVHAGWPGTIKRAAGLAVAKMRNKYGTKPVDILAAIGPSIGPHHYQIGPEVVTQVITEFGEDAKRLLQQSINDPPDKKQFDLWKANQMILDQTGVRHIEISSICTACNIGDWYSHRGENGRTGRFGALIALNSIG
ncbi:peptidoglycan editing factor PgeF, partial [Chloroflexota bacterium]